MATVSAPDVTKKLFGGIFDVDGSGHYPGLELINLVVCCKEGTLPNDEKVHIYRVAHDFGRQLITEQLEQERRNQCSWTTTPPLSLHTCFAVLSLKFQT